MGRWAATLRTSPVSPHLPGTVFGALESGGIMGSLTLFKTLLALFVAAGLTIAAATAWASYDSGLSPIRPPGQDPAKKLGVPEIGTTGFAAGLPIVLGGVALIATPRRKRAAK